MAKRLFDLIFAGMGLVYLFPLFILVALWIKLDSKGPVFFRQERVGRNGAPFRIHKFRTMTWNTAGPAITVAGDRRVLPSGKWLRRFKIDELPQLIDVVLGHMSLVGPRPEVPEYVALYPERERRIILSVRPGITDLASIEFRHENDLLARAEDPEKEYRETVLPKKIAYYVRYVETQTLLGDLQIILKTLEALFK